MAKGDRHSHGHSRAELLEAAFGLLARRLPPGWSAEKRALEEERGELDLVISDATGSECLVLVEAKLDLSQRDAKAFTSGLPRRLRRETKAALLVVAPLIGPRARQHLQAERISYIDLTGNVRILLDNPGLLVETDGLHQDSGVAKPTTSLRGDQAGAVIRLLVDVRPPFTAADVATAVSVNEGYVSRILGILLEEDLIERPGRGPVTEVDWQGVIRRRAKAVDLLKRSGTYRFVASGDPTELLRAGAIGGSDAVVSGPLAAARLGAAAPEALLTAYTKDPNGLAAHLDLVPARGDANVLLMRPGNPVVFDRVAIEESVQYAAPSQVAIDCLAGDPITQSQGLAVLAWMQGNEDGWRLPSIEDFFNSILP